MRTAVTTGTRWAGLLATILLAIGLAGLASAQPTAGSRLSWLQLDAGERAYSVDGFGTVDIPAEAFSTPGEIRLLRETREDLIQLFEDQRRIFRVDRILQSFFVIELKPDVPASERNLQVRLELPQDFVAQKAPTQSLRAFAYFFNRGEEGSFETFEPLSEAVDEDILSFRLPAWFFNGVDNGDPSFEAVIAVAIVDPRPEGTGDPAIACADLGPPLAEIEPTLYSSRFGPRRHPLTGAETYHYGTDYAVPAGTPLRALADGEISWVGFQTRASGNALVGWGHWMMMEHDDGSVAIYAHLSCSNNSRPCNDYSRRPIKRGEIVARAGSSGGVTGPHLHLEVVTSLNGSWNDSRKIDPFSCVSECDDLALCGGNLTCDTGANSPVEDGFRPRRCRNSCTTDTDCGDAVCFEDIALCGRLDEADPQMVEIPTVDCGGCWRAVSVYPCGMDAPPPLCPDASEDQRVFSGCAWWQPGSETAPEIFADLPRCGQNGARPGSEAEPAE